MEERLESGQILDEALGASGLVFGGQRIRKFPLKKQRHKGSHILSSRLNATSGDCTKWGVMTTIHAPPSESIRRFLYLKEWCVVVVGDKVLNEKVCI